MAGARGGRGGAPSSDGSFQRMLAAGQTWNESAPFSYTGAQNYSRGAPSAAGHPGAGYGRLPAPGPAHSMPYNNGYGAEGLGMTGAPGFGYVRCKRFQYALE